MKWNTVKEVYEHIKNPLECEDVLTFLCQRLMRMTLSLILLEM